MNWLTQPLERVFLRPLRSLGGLSFDVVVSEEHEDTLTIAKHPVEQGANISDHAYRNPCKVVIRGASSESTYGLPVWDPYNATLYNALLALQNEPIMITGALIGNYIDMYRVLQAKRSRRSLKKVQDEYIRFLRSMSKGTEPTKYIQLAYLTRILTIKKERTMEEPKRLYRSNNGMIAGVCAGIADYFGWDPTLVRIGYILLSIFTVFSGVIAYLILWMVIPKQPINKG